MIVLAMLMLYSMALLRLGLAVTTVAWLATSLTGLAVAVTAIGSRQPRPGLPPAARRILRAATDPGTIGTDVADRGDQ